MLSCTQVVSPLHNPRDVALVCPIVSAASAGAAPAVSANPPNVATTESKPILRTIHISFAWRHPGPPHPRTGRLSQSPSGVSREIARARKELLRGGVVTNQTL